MKQMNNLLWIFLLLILNACNQQPASQDSVIVIDTLKEETAIKSVLIEMWDAIEKNDIDRYAKYVHADFTQFGENDSTLLVGKSNEVGSIKNWMERSSNIHTEMIDPKITIKGNTAWITYYWSDAGTSNGQSFSSRGKSTRIFVKENNQWLCIHGHYTLLP